MFALNRLTRPAWGTMNRLCLLQHHYFGVIKFNLPDLGQKIKQGTIKKLYIKEGEEVEEFQKLADVASDKQFTQLTASNSGIIKKIYYQEEDVCQVGDLFLEIVVKDDNDVPQPEGQNFECVKVKEHLAHQEANKQGQVSTQEVLATPFVRGLIKKHGLDTSKIQGTGPGGRITEKDVESIVSQPTGTSIPQPPPPTRTSQTPSPAAPPKVIASGSSQTVPMTPFEKGMQKSMTESNTIPHLYLHEEFDITQIEKMRKSLKANNQKVTVMGILIKTFSLALKQFPRINSLYNPLTNPNEYEVHPSHNVSIAIDSPNGLVVPHIKNVQALNLSGIQGELQRLRNLASEAKLTGKELQGGTICLSNIGTIGGTHACPLILPPQVCIVAIGKLQTVPRYIDGELKQRKVINVSYGCDHRVIDGATAARFSNTWKQLIENPYLSIAQMI